MSRVVVRYAPSPTGIPHIGNIRTALFNFLFAKNQNGQFILRIEDTDRKRFIPESVAQIKESLKILGLNWDGQEFYQSKRLDLYQKHLAILKKKQLTYNKEGAWYFKVEKDKKVSWQDLLHGPIGFSSNVIEDFVVIKSDSFPTYHFASVVDDHLMKITHVMRGDEWISSTPKHLLLYEAFSWSPPKFIHLPPILGPNRQKLSKREGARSVLEYVEDGFLPEALVNFLALLGWSPPPPQHLRGGRMDSPEVKIKEKELFTLEELTREFSLDRLNKNSPIFNLEKLNWFNKKHMQVLSTDELAKKIKEISKLSTPEVKRAYTSGVKVKIDEERFTKIVSLIRDRLTTLADFDKYASIFFQKGKLKPPTKIKIQNAQEAILSIVSWNEESIGQKLDQWISQKKLDPADFKNTLRLAVFADNTPPIYQSLSVLSKDEVLKRIDDAIKKSK